MNDPVEVDLAILGAGCAGLSLARELALHQVEESVLLLEPRLEYTDDRSWCFWANNQSDLSDQLSPLISRSWPNWAFGLQGAVQESRSCPGIQYHYVRSIDFYSSCIAALEKCTSIKLRLGSAVVDVTPHEKGWQIKCNDEHYIAKQVVDTRPPPASMVQQSTLFQCFMGVELRLDDDNCVNQNEAELMTRMQLTNNTFCFNYVLPYSENHLLAEITYFADKPFSREELQNKLDQLISDRGWQHQAILRKEFGMLPMGLPYTEATPGTLPIQAGLRGGALRPSSGYGFMRIQRWATLCAQRYCNSGQLIPQVTSGFWLSWMDKIFLNVLKIEPQLAPDLFYRLLSKLPPKRFVRFMNDQANLFDCVSVMACLPKTPFVKALLRLISKR